VQEAALAVIVVDREVHRAARLQSGKKHAAHPDTRSELAASFPVLVFSCRF
jgi:hypothetical protein